MRPAVERKRLSEPGSDQRALAVARTGVRDVENLRERFMRDDMPTRLGGIAANLARIGSFASNPANRQAVFDLIEESKWFIEWAAPSVEPEVAARLAEMQVSLAVIEARMRAGDVDVPALIQSASAWSGEVLEMSGLAR